VEKGKEERMVGVSIIIKHREDCPNGDIDRVLMRIYF
jgi:hypothetical protein